MTPLDGTEWEGFMRALATLLFVIALILLCAYAARKIGLDKYFGAAHTGAKRRLKLIETLYLDPRTRIFIVQIDNQEHSILLSPTGSVVLHTAAAREELPADHA